MPTIISGDGTITGLTATGISAVQNLPAGSVLQVVNASTSTQVSNSTNVFADTGLTATITPKFATSKILVIVDQAGCANSYTNGSLLSLRLLRNSTSLLLFSAYGGFNTGGTLTMDFGSCSTNFLDSPATTSATTYKTQLNSTNNVGAMYVQYQTCSSTITLMEIAQ